MAKFKKTTGWFAKADVYGPYENVTKKLHSRILASVEVHVAVFQRLECGHLLSYYPSVKGKVRAICLECDDAGYGFFTFDDTWEQVEGPNDPRLSEIASKALKAKVAEIQ